MSQNSPLRKDAIVFFALLGLTALTVGIARIDLGALNGIVALGIAAIKAFLVLYFFMELRHSFATIWLYALGGMIWLAILILGILTDVLTRGVG